MNPPMETDEGDEKPRTLFVGNVPSTTKKRDLEILFGDVGPIKRCHLQYPRKRPGDSSKKEDPLVAYITYALTQDATTALEKFSNHRIENSKLNIKLVKSRADQFREPRVGRPPTDFGRDFSRPAESSHPGGFGRPADGNPDGEASDKSKNSGPRPPKNVKKARLIVRNISFQTTEENLRTHFETCGEVKEVNLLRKRTGKLVGCAFVQYNNVHECFKALKDLNAKEFLGRPIVIDWAVSKEKYQKEATQGKNKEVKKEDEDKVKVKEEESIEIKSENESDEDEDNEDGSDDEENEEKDVKPRIPVNSNDADEGKTLFLRNLSFDVTEEELQEFFKKFGDLKYALICKDSLTEHPKGTGFVKFKDLDSATECLTKFEEDSTEFELHDRSFFVIKAMSKGKLEEKMNEGKDTSAKDNRRLFLAREGFIRPGSDAAANVSKTDMNKRAAIHKAKNQMLKDLNIFVSDTRLCVHNLPVTLKDENLRKIFLKYAGTNPKITEARIMRDFNSIHRESKGYGFVTFTNHENALEALRTINNNPDIFTPNKRPIVEFSLENRKAIKAKERRLEKSQQNVGKQQQEETNEEEPEEGKQSKRQKRKAKKAKKVDDTAEEESKPEINSEDEPVPKKKKLRHRDEDSVPAFSGLSGKKGITSLPSLKAKGKITRKSLKRSKVKKTPRRMREGKTLPKNNRAEATDNVDRMVSKYQKQVARAESGEKKRGKKWFD